MVENTELLPFPAAVAETGPLVPPPPTVIGKAVAVTVILFPGVEYPSNGLAV